MLGWDSRVRTRLVDITPDRSPLPKLGFAGYSAPQAIAESLIRESHEDLAYAEEIKDLILRKALELKLEMAK